MSDTAFKISLAALLAFGWGVGVVTMRLMSPNRRLVANPLIARVGWRLALVGLLIPLLPFYNPVIGIALIGPTFLLASSNLEKAWLVRSLGETRYRALLEEAAAGGHLGVAIATNFMAGLLVASIGGVLMLVSSAGKFEWSWWFGFGFIIYGVAVALMKSHFVWRIHRHATPSPSAT